MTVYKKKNSPYWHFDFQIRGKRIHGSTGVDSKRAAEAIERDMRRKAASGELDDASLMTLDAAAGRWWTERGSDLKGGDRLEARIERVITLLGPSTPISQITTEAVSRAIERRRGQAIKKSKAKDAKAYLPSNSTVNRDMIDTLRPILNRARKAWGAKLPEIDWQALRMREPKPKPKEFVGDDLAHVLAEVQPHWHDLIMFASRYGCRLSELFFSLDDLDVGDLENARLKLRERKGDDDHVIPLLPEDAAMLAGLLGRARAAGLETVWFKEKRGKGPGAKTYLRALTAGGVAIAMRRAMVRTGLKASKGMRGMHDLRHHSGMQILRQTGNIRLAQKLLGHADLKSTMVYAHVIDADLKAGLAGLSRNSPEQAAEQGEKAQTKQPAKPSRAAGS